MNDYGRPKANNPYESGPRGSAAGAQAQQARRERMNRPVEILPNPELLESYDCVVEGSAKMILSMFEQEQKHRHRWEMQAIKIHSFGSLLGQMLGFLIATAVFVSATVIGIYGDSNIAAFIWVFGMAIVSMAGLVWAYAKSMGQRPLFGRPAMRTHFRPYRQRPERHEQGDAEGEAQGG